MREIDIKDSDIPQADPETVLKQYEPLIKKLAARCTSILERSGAVGIDDLYQAGRLAVLQAQPQYDPAAGASFLSFVYKPVQWAIWRTVGIDSNTGKPPEHLVYLDEPLPGVDGEDITLMDALADPDAIPIDEPLIEEETRTETAAAVRAAVDRMSSEKQRDIIKRVYLDGQTRQQAAEETGVKVTTVYSLEDAGCRTLRRDYRLRKYAETVPFVHVGVKRFNTTWTSATEYAAMWRLEHLPESMDNRRPPELPENTRNRIRDL